ncbi:MAG: DUF4232 domain-containing protein [Microbacteriaceae bacterium]|nr:MAG: DUF4232 domain-containing protein [Microbacteriaceae bacterium]
MSGLPRADGAAQKPKRTGLIITIVILAVILLGLIVAVVVVALRNDASPMPPTTSPVTSAPATPSATPTSTSTTTPAVTRCTIAQLSVALGQPNGAAGSELVPILFTNTGSTPCELHGFPGVSFVGQGNGTQLGAAAAEDSSDAMVQNTLQPGGIVQAPLKIVNAQLQSTCTIVHADGLRVYPPHSFQAVFVQASGLSACSNTDVSLLTVKPVQPQ